MSLLFSPSYLSPLSPLSPISQIKVTPYSTQITTANVFAPVYPYVAYVDVDTGLNSSYIVQKDVTEYLWYRILDKWFYSNELCHLLKYFKIENGEVKFVSNENEAKNNKVCDDSVENIEKKTDFIQENLLTLNDMKKLLQRIISELDYKWYELTNKEKLVVEVVERHLRKLLEQRIGSK
jgi:hypothetical protein